MCCRYWGGVGGVGDEFVDEGWGCNGCCNQPVLFWSAGFAVASGCVFTLLTKTHPLTSTHCGTHDTTPHALTLNTWQVAGETVDEATLTQVLLAVLDSQQQQQQQPYFDPKSVGDAAAAAAATTTQGCVAVSEVEAAAHYIVQRYGKSARKVAEQALKEVRLAT